jgi:hypothetical protein
MDRDLSRDDADPSPLLDANLYLTLGTVDPDGSPWTSPVYFAAAGEREFYWARGQKRYDVVLDLVGNRT